MMAWIKPIKAKIYYKDGRVEKKKFTSHVLLGQYVSPKEVIGFKEVESFSYRMTRKFRKWWKANR